MIEFLSMLFYQILIRLYRVAVFIASFFNEKANLWIAGRKDWRTKLAQLDRHKKTVWFHTASLGEYEQAKPVIEKLKSQNPDTQILVTFFSPSGFEVRKNEKLADLVGYLPLDTAKNARDFVELVKPDLAIFVRYEFWPNLMDELYKRQITTTVISAHFRRDQFLFKPLGKFIKKRLGRLNKILVQYKDSKEILLENGIRSEQVIVCGDSRIDRVLDIAKQRTPNPILENFVQDKRVLVLGSSYTDEESFTFPLIEKEKDLKIIIAPHYIDDNNVNRIVDSLPVKAIRYTQVSSPEEIKNAQVLILDTMGMLASAYQYGHYALVGGGFKDGIHSILEPAAFGLPLFFGPHHKSFTEAQGLIDAVGGFEIQNQGSFLKKFTPLFKEEEKRKITGQKVSAFVNLHAGASNLITQALLQLLKSEFSILEN